jgi:hypothetical protein
MKKFMATNCALFARQTKGFGFDRFGQSKAGFRFQLGDDGANRRNGALLFAFNNQAQQAGNAQPFTQRRPAAQFFVNQQKIRAGFLGEDDGFGLTQIQFGFQSGHLNLIGNSLHL